MQKNIDKETQEFLTWLKNKYKDIDELKISEMQKDGSLEKEYKKSKALKAEHGAKLNYFRKLKRICSDDEELVYFKRGGSIDCGCVKKEEGGKAPQKKSSNKAVEDFKNKKLDLATKDSIAANVYNDQEVQDTKPGFYKKNKNGKVQWTPDRTKVPYKKTCGGSMKKKYLNGGSLNGIPFIRKGNH